MRTTHLTALCLALLALPLGGCDRSSESSPDVSESKASNPALGARWQYPREREVNGRKVIVYAPQIRSWDEFRHFTAQVAVEVLAEDADARYGVIDLSGDTVVDREKRIVSVPKPKVDRVTFSSGQGSAEHEGGIRTALLGLAIHFFIATVVVTVYYFASRRIAVLRRSPVLMGIFYGLLVYAFMYGVVLPLSAAGPPKFTWPFWLNGPFAHVFCVGIPTGLLARAKDGQPELQTA